MFTFIKHQKGKFLFSTMARLVVFVLSFSLIFSPTASYAQSVLNLPAPGTMIPLSVSYNPAIVKGITLYPDNPLKFDFIIDPGDDNLQGEVLKDEANKLIKYFMASLTVPEDEMWVNLSPYEKDRIIADGLSQTELGRDLLVQDYILKQLTASLMYPEEELGNKFWERVYAKAHEKYGASEIPIDTFNKVWIVPDKANVYVNGNNIFVVDNHLKVMLEEDYLVLESNLGHNKHGVGEISDNQAKEIIDISSEIIREVLISEIEREVNEGKNFANLRQIFNSMILATWYKQNLRGSLLGQVYVNQNKVNGIDLEDKQIKEKIYNQYLEAFEKGVYNYIKEDYDEATQQIIPRKYFSGGFAGDKLGKVGSSPVEAGERKELLSGREQVFTVDNREVPLGSSPIIVRDVVKKIADLYFKPKFFEKWGNGKLYEILGVRQYARWWKTSKYIQEYLIVEDVVDHTLDKGINPRIESSKSFELGHLVVGIIMEVAAFAILFAKWDLALNISLASIATTINMIYNIYPIMFQRYLRTRLTNVLEKRNRSPINNPKQLSEDAIQRLVGRLRELGLTGYFLSRSNPELSIPGVPILRSFKHMYRNWDRDPTLESPLTSYDHKILFFLPFLGVTVLFLIFFPVFSQNPLFSVILYVLVQLMVLKSPTAPLHRTAIRNEASIPYNAKRFLKENGNIELNEDLAGLAKWFEEKTGWSITWTDNPYILAWPRPQSKEVVMSIGWIVKGDHPKHLKRRSAYMVHILDQLRSHDKFSSGNDSGSNDRDSAQPSSSPVQSKDRITQATDEYGGIDLNPENLILNVQGNDIKMDFSNPQILNNISIDGFIPVIINVAPITNIPMLLGESEEQSDDFSLSQLN